MKKNVNGIRQMREKPKSNINRNSSDTKKRKIRKKKSKRFGLKSKVKYIAFTIIFTCIAIPFSLMYGPFTNVKKTFVGTAMGSMHYKWIATLFLSDNKINEILSSNNSIDNDVSNINSEESELLDISKNKDDTIELKEISDENNKFKGYALIVYNPTRVHIGVSSKLFEEGEAISTIAEKYNAVAAINGGYFTDKQGDERWTSNGAIPEGFLMTDGEIKQDIDHNIESPIVAITKEGKLLIGETTINNLLSKKENDKDTVTNAMSYETTLIENGQPVPIKVAQGSAPRTMIGQRINGEIVLVVLDSAISGIGNRFCASLEEARKVMMDLNCYNAINLDGGKSTTMYFNGEIINNPSYKIGERPISAGFIVK